jgi:hypothetical protein
VLVPEVSFNDGGAATHPRFVTRRSRDDINHGDRSPLL